MVLTARWWAIWGTLLAAPMLWFGFLLLNPSYDKTWGTGPGHFWVVSGTALAAMVACALIIGITDSMRETRLVFLGLAFLSIAGIFAVHGLGTPGHLHSTLQPELLVSSWLSVFTGALLIAASVINLPEKAEEWLKRNGALVAGGVTALIGTYIGLSFAANGWLGFIPVENRNLQLLMTGITLAVLGFSAWRYFQAFLFARLPSQWAMVVALILLMQVQVSLTFGWYFHYSWWLYHWLYAVAFVIMFSGWYLEARRAGSLRVIAEALSMRDAVSQLNQGHSAPIAELVDAIEWKDVYTLGHVRRVASYAVMTGKELGLSILDLRALALGAQMHDVGKIGVPDRILTKPSALTEEERTVIQQHSERGFEIALRVKALQPALDGIRYHHERFDGLGYPLGMKGEDIPLQARIVAVADAFDAMTSGRVYQPAISFDKAFSELESCAGTHFDPAVVAAFGRAMSRIRDVVRQDPPATVQPGKTDPVAA